MRPTFLVPALVLALVPGLAGCVDADRAEAELVEQRAEVRDLLADLARPVVAAGLARAELRGGYEGCESDTLAQGYTSYTYSGGGRIAGGATLDDVEEALRDLEATRVERDGDELRATRGDVSLVVTRRPDALVVLARAAPCLEVPDDPAGEWLDREQRAPIPLGD